MGYEVLATVNSFEELANIRTNYHLQAGDRVKLDFQVQWPFGSAFNLAGVENLFNPLMPDHMFLIDVGSDNPNSAYIEMEATSPPLAVVLAAIPAWAYIILASGVALAAIIITITVSVKISQTPATLVSTGLLIGVVAIVLGTIWIKSGAPLPRRAT
jgi:hypothetical protein